VPVCERDDMTIYDIAPTILAQAGLTPEDSMRGRVLAHAESRSIPLP
jgi:predicted AlkP superfamily phosphohydrolase/phosphomutase